MRIAERSRAVLADQAGNAAAAASIAARAPATPTSATSAISAPLAGLWTGLRFAAAVQTPPM